MSFLEIEVRLLPVRGLGLINLMKIITSCIIIFFASISLSYFYGSSFESRPVISDELAYHFQGQTFLKGRVTNQTPASPEHFESQGLLVEPTFSSKYPPLLAFGLAMGEKFFGDEHLVGRLCLALSCCLIFLTLMEFFSFSLSLSVSLIATFNSFYVFEFANSYRPAAISLFAACLVYYSCLKFLRVSQLSSPHTFKAQCLYGLSIGLGLGMLVLSRPFIGAITFVLSVSFLFYKLWTRNLRFWVIPFVSVILLCVSLQLFVNYRVTKNIWKHPHSLVSEKYFMNPGFNFLSKDEPRDYGGNRFLERYYYEWEREIFQRQTTISGYISEYFSRKIHKYIMFHSTYYLVPFFIIGFIFLLVDLLSKRRAQNVFMALSLLGYFVSSLFVVGHLYYYTVTFLPVLLFLIAKGVNATLNFTAHERWSLILSRSLIMVLVLLSITQLNMHGFSFAMSRTDRGVYYKREFESSFQTKWPNKKLVIFSHFSESHSIFDSWIYNDPNILSAPILWVTDLGRERNQNFLKNYPDRLGVCVLFDNSSPVIDPASDCY